VGAGLQEQQIESRGVDGHGQLLKKMLRRNVVDAGGRVNRGRGRAIIPVS